MAAAVLPPLVQRLLARHGLAEVPARRVAAGDGEVWRVGPLPASGDDSAWRALRIWRGDGIDRDALDTRIAWLGALADEGLRVPAPVRDRSGQVLMHEAHADTVMVALLQHWLPGRIVVAGLRPIHLWRTGRLMARLHAHAARFAASGGIRSGRVNGVPLDDWAAGRLSPSALCPPRLALAVASTCLRLKERVAAWPRDPCHWGYLHGDLHPWNLVHHQRDVGAIDFGDSGWGWWAQEFASVLQWLHEPLPDWPVQAAYPALRDALFEGYASRRPLPPDLSARLDDLLLLRRLGTLQWMVEDWPRSDHRPWGPTFLRRLQRALTAA